MASASASASASVSASGTGTGTGTDESASSSATSSAPSSAWRSIGRDVFVFVDGERVGTRESRVRVDAVVRDHRSRVRRPGGQGGARVCAAIDFGGSVKGGVVWLFPTRSHTVAAQGGINAALGNMTEDDWRWHATPSRGGLARRQGAFVLCREPGGGQLKKRHAVLGGGRGKIYQRAFGGQSLDYGKGGQAYRCAAARSAGQPCCTALASVEHGVQFFVEYFALDLIMDKGECVGVMALCLGRHHSQVQIAPDHLATGGYGRAC